MVPLFKRLKILFFLFVIPLTPMVQASQKITNRLIREIDDLIHYLEINSNRSISSLPQHLENPNNTKEITLENLFSNNKPSVSNEIANRVCFQVGTFLNVHPLKKARKPSYKMTFLLGEGQEMTTCGQFVRHYPFIENIERCQGLGLTNLPPMRIAGTKSSVLTLGFPEKEGDSQAIYLTPFEPVEPGSFVSFSLDQSQKVYNQISYDDFISLEIKSGTIVDVINYPECDIVLLDMGKNLQVLASVNGKLDSRFSDYRGVQVPVLLNLVPFPSVKGPLHAMLFTVPSTVNQYVTLICVSKAVDNGLDLF